MRSIVCARNLQSDCLDCILVCERFCYFVSFVSLPFATSANFVFAATLMNWSEDVLHEKIEFVALHFCFITVVVNHICFRRFHSQFGKSVSVSASKTYCQN